MVKSPTLEENIPQLLTDVIDITFTRPTEYPYYECMDAHLFFCYKKKILSVW